MRIALRTREPARSTRSSCRRRASPLSVAAPARRVRAAEFLRHDAFEAHLAGGGEQPLAVVDGLAHAVRGFLAHLDRIRHPFAPTLDRLIDQRASVEIETVENVADGGALVARARGGLLAALAHAV